MRVLMTAPSPPPKKKNFSLIMHMFNETGKGCYMQQWIKGRAISGKLWLAVEIVVFHF
jgi:hypothetical protein